MLSSFATRYGFIPLLLSLVLVATAVPTGASAEDPVRAAFVYNGTVGGDGWTHRHEQGRQYLMRQLGDKVETTYVEKVPEGSDSARVFEQLAQKGYDIIFGTSFGYMDPMLKVSKRHPDVAFLNGAGFKTGKNMGNYFIRTYQTSYLSGIVAAYHIDDGPVGYVAPHPVPSTLRQINAFTLGLREIKPDAKVRLVWTNSWHDPAKEADAAQSLIDVGAELIAQYADSPAPVQTAEDNGVPSIGFYMDMSDEGPSTNLTSPVMNWGPYYVKVTREVMNGTWEPESYWEGMSKGLTYLAPFTDQVKAQAMRTVSKHRVAILSGQRDVFEGPIRDQDGKLRVKEGNRLSDRKLFGLDWLVEGVQGEIPQ